MFKEGDWVITRYAAEPAYFKLGQEYTDYNGRTRHFRVENQQDAFLPFESCHPVAPLMVLFLEASYDTSVPE